MDKGGLGGVFSGYDQLVRCVPHYQSFIIGDDVHKQNFHHLNGRSLVNVRSINTWVRYLKRAFRNKRPFALNTFESNESFHANVRLFCVGKRTKHALGDVSP